MTRTLSAGPLPATLRLYGISNCDTVKRARAWLAGEGVLVEFVDFKKQGVPEPALAQWLATLGWERLLNRQGSTWRKLAPEAQAAVQSSESAAALMRAQPSVIRRPLVEWAAGEFTLGFEEDEWVKRIEALRKAF